MDKKVENTRRDLSSKKIFRPLVASSLAIALGASVATATCTTSSNPLICYGTSSANNVFASSGNATLSWINNTAQAYSPKVVEDKSQTYIDNLVFKFTNEDPSKAPIAEATKGIYQNTEIEKEYQKYIISMGAGANRDVSNNDLDAPLAGSSTTISSLKFDARGKAIKLGEFGDGTITLDFGDFTSNGLRNMELHFNGDAPLSIIDNTPSPFLNMRSSSYAFVGNLAILSGDEATYNITFDHSMHGDITIYTNSFRNWTKYISGTHGKITFKDNANLEGSIRSRVNGGDANTTKGGVEIVFGENASSNNMVTGDISFVHGVNTITFKGNGTIGGSLVAGGSGYVEGDQPNADGSKHYVEIFGSNTVSFGGTGSIGDVTSNAGYNHITAATSLQVADVSATNYAENIITAATSLQVANVNVANYAQNILAQDKLKTLLGVFSYDETDEKQVYLSLLQFQRKNLEKY